jgi:hypothetical protein
LRGKRQAGQNQAAVVAQPLKRRPRLWALRDGQPGLDPLKILARAGDILLDTTSLLTRAADRRHQQRGV